MRRTIQQKRTFLKNLYVGPFEGHALSAFPELPADPLGDFTCSTRPVADWVPYSRRRMETVVEFAEKLDLDYVPGVSLNTNTGIFAAAFGCPLHVYEGNGSPACALPAVETAAQADALPQPDIHKAPTLARIFELAARLRDAFGPDMPIGVPDIQSPFDIAALVWKKEELFAALIENPDAVKRLVAKCHRLLADFLLAFKREFPNCNLAHCPGTAWAPPELGCWLSEDEVGSMSADMFAEFVLPILSAMSREFGGLFMHCCAAADHQYENFSRIPNLRGLNRVFQAPGPEPAIRRFSGSTVLIQAWIGEADVMRFLDLARPDTRFFFELSAMKLDAARPVVARLREACARSAAR